MDTHYTQPTSTLNRYKDRFVITTDHAHSRLGATTSRCRRLVKEEKWACITLTHWTNGNSRSCCFTSIFCELVVIRIVDHGFPVLSYIKNDLRVADVTVSVPFPSRRRITTSVHATSVTQSPEYLVPFEMKGQTRTKVTAGAEGRTPARTASQYYV
ncbi:hypothetical protein EVAR_2227_1 [Eumeta japonica]|uniref:Uncharacterized protein n=1 Tax=Eumeta variegata TaxID=151549 RepID=A0A4C1SIE1_EUMVA|nr:hypothetical protein EVAR_2227_1 [Eumeta japonica]